MRNYYLQFEEHGAADNQSLTVNGGAAAVHQVQMSQVLQQHIGRSLPLPVSSGKIVLHLSLPRGALALLPVTNYIHRRRRPSGNSVRVRQRETRFRT